MDRPKFPDFEVVLNEVTGALEIRTPFDGDVDGDTGAHTVVGGELIAVLDDSSIAEDAADLIAAAPAMYEALKAAKAVLDQVAAQGAKVGPLYSHALQASHQIAAALPHPEETER